MIACATYRTYLIRRGEQERPFEEAVNLYGDLGCDCLSLHCVPLHVIPLMCFSHSVNCDPEHHNGALVLDLALHVHSHCDVFS